MHDNAVQAGQVKEFQLALDMAVEKITIPNLQAMHIVNGLAGYRGNYTISSEVAMVKLDEVVTRRLVINELQKMPKPARRSFTTGGKAGVASAFVGAVLAAIGGGLYANSGAGLAEGTTNDPLTVYLTTLGQIAQQLTSN